MTDEKPTIHVIPIGTNLWMTALTSGWFARNFPDQVEAFKDQERALRRPEARLGSPVDILLPDFLGAQRTEAAQRLQKYADRANPEYWPAVSSSEIHTLSAVTGRKSSPYLPEGDAALLIASNDEVVMAALWTALIITGNDPARISYREDATSDLSDLRGRVVITRISDLDAANDRNFRRAMRHLGQLGYGLQNLADEMQSHPDFAFLLTGGYRATVPYLAGIAELLQTSAGVGKVSASVLHSSTESGVIPYPLRALVHEIFVGEVLPLVKGRKRAPGDRHLEGYAYETNSAGEDELTPFGESLAQMVDPDAVL